MKPYYGALNDENQWWDGKTWKNLARPEDGKGQSETMFTQMEKVREHDLFNCHVNGVFTCPRCRRPHFIPDQFDYLCDGCVTILNTHPNTSETVKRGLAEWAEKRKGRYTHPDIMARLAERDHLEAIARLDLVEPLSTPEGRKYVEALPAVTQALDGRTMRVGFYTQYIAYRARWDDRKQSGNWAFMYMGGLEPYHGKQKV